jgi:hypothetical protein
MTEAVHRHGSLAGVELWHGGGSAGNLFYRESAVGSASLPGGIAYMPEQGAAMDKADIREFRRWHVDAAICRALARTSRIFGGANFSEARCDYLLLRSSSTWRRWARSFTLHSEFHPPVAPCSGLGTSVARL